MIISPNIYDKNFKWEILPRNKIDTVSMKPISNAVSDRTTVATVTINDSLPIEDTIAPDKVLASIGNESTRRLALGKVEVKTYKGSYTFNLDKPLTNKPSIEVTFNGHTHAITRGTSSWSTMYDSFFSNNSAAWITNHKSTDATTWENNSASVNYKNSSVPMFTWAKKIVPAQYPATGEYYNVPDEEDILTQWADVVGQSTWPLTDGWKWTSSYPYWNPESGIDTTLMWPYWERRPVESPYIPSARIAIANRYFDVITNLVIVDDYTYRVDYEIPARYVYMAVSQYYTKNIFGKITYHDLDNYSFVDYIDSFKIDLVAATINTDSSQLSYSLDSAGNLTENVKNNHPMSFSDNLFITLNTFWGTDKWTEKMPQHLLQQYAKGKFIVTCDINATWAIKNGVVAGARCNIKLQDSTFISRKGVTSTFEVKNIEKYFKNDQFIYRIKLMEV